MSIFATRLVMVIMPFLGGCTTASLSCYLYNNADHAIQVHRTNGSGERETFNIESHQKKEIMNWPMYDYRIRSGANEWKYKTVKPYSKYIETVQLGIIGFKRIWKAQIEQDGKIYVVPVKSNFPINDFSGQPENFPIIPAQ